MPSDLDESLGGSEECVVLLAEAFARAGFNVTVYITPPADRPLVGEALNGVNYLPRGQAEAWHKDIFITFKDPSPFISGAEAAAKIHWSSDVEPIWNTEKVDAFVNLTSWHYSRNVFVPDQKSTIIAHGIDVDSLDRNKVDKKEKQILYCSSPDRGLIDLLNDWPKIRENHGVDFELIVSYGFGFFDRNPTPRNQTFKNDLVKLMDQPGVNYIGAVTRDEIEALYHQSEYWVLPLFLPDAELFCLNALKARHCGAIPIVRRIGALTDTVGDHIEYDKFIQGTSKVTTVRAEETVAVHTWDEVVEKGWIPLIDSIRTKEERQLQRVVSEGVENGVESGKSVPKSEGVAGNTESRAPAQP